MNSHSQLDDVTRSTIHKRISEVERKLLDKLQYIENSGALSGDESAGVIMAYLTSELAEGYSHAHSSSEFKNLKRF